MDPQAKVDLCEALLEYSFNDKKLLCEALQTSGEVIVWGNTIVKIPNNTRLAIYGDLALSKALCGLWYPKPLDKGAWASIREEIRNTMLAKAGTQLGLPKCVIQNSGQRQAPSAGTMATTVGALLGAVELDGGSEAMLKVARHLDLVPQSIK